MGKDEGKPCIARRDFIRPFAGGAAEAGRTAKGEKMRLRNACWRALANATSAA